MIKLFDSKMNEVVIKREMYQWDIFPLDNFSAFGFLMDGEYFQTGEHAFQYLKFVDTNKEIANKIKGSFSPNEARSIAHENKKFRLANWSDVKYQKMEKVFRLKVEQNPIVKEVLLNTKDYIIAENCIDEDSDWGLDKNNQGSNNLGKIWMKIRDEIKGINKK